MRERAGVQGPSAHVWLPGHSLRDGRRSEVSRRSWPGAPEDQQIIGDDPQPDPALHPALTAVPASPQAMTALERADPSFTPRAPAEGRAGHPGAPLAGLPRQHDVPDPTVSRRAFIGARGKAAVGDGQARRVTEERDVTIQSRRPEGAVRLAALTDLVVGDELRLGFPGSSRAGRTRWVGPAGLSE